jgi:hypothetical protein
VSSVSVSVGDIAGTYSNTITGTNLTGATSVAFDFTAATSVVVVNPTTVTCVVPAHVTGVVDVSVTTPGGTGTLTSGFEYFSPAQLSLTGWWRGSYAGAPWAGTASAGASGGVSQATAGSDPTAGTAVNGITPAHSTGAANQKLYAGATIGTLLPASSYTMITLCKPGAAAAPVGVLYSDPSPVGDVYDGDVGFAYNTSGFKFYHCAGASTYQGPAYVATTSGAWHALAGRYDGTTMRFSVDGSADVTLASVNPGGAGWAASELSVFGAYGAAAGTFPGDVLEIITAVSSISDPNWSKIRAYFRTRYGVTV